MISFGKFLSSDLPEDYISEQVEFDMSLFDSLEEALVTFGGKAFPQYGQFVILAGGGGSGKGFVRKKLLGIEGMVFDVDDLKELALKAPKIKQKVKDELGYDLDKFNLGNPEDVSNLHAIVGDHLNLDNKKKITAANSILSAAPDRKPNIIFDVTLKDARKFENLTNMARKLGYLPKNVHIVWVVNDIKIALAQNASRERRVPTEILINTHRGVSSTMNDILKMGSTLEKYMDGDIVLVFNAAKIDSTVLKTVVDADNRPASPVINAKKDSKGLVIDKQDYVYVKKAGSPCKSFDEISKATKQKIASYVPSGVNWS